MAAAALASGRRPGGGAGPGFHVASGVGPAFSSRHGGGGNGMEMIKELNFSFYLKFSTSINFNGKKFMNDEIFTIKPLSELSRNSPGLFKTPLVAKIHEDGDPW